MSCHLPSGDHEVLKNGQIFQPICGHSWDRNVTGIHTMELPTTGISIDTITGTTNTVPTPHRSPPSRILTGSVSIRQTLRIDLLEHCVFDSPSVLTGNIPSHARLFLSCSQHNYWIRELELNFMNSLFDLFLYSSTLSLDSSRLRH